MDDQRPVTSEQDLAPQSEPSVPNDGVGVEAPKQTSLLPSKNGSVDANGSGSETPLPPVAPEDLPGLLLALILVAPGATTVGELARGSGQSSEAVEAALTELELNLQSDALDAWVLQRHGESVQLATSPRYASYVRRFLGLDRETKLSAAAIETLAIIAYQQPVTRSDIEAVRGVDCSGVLATLHGRGLIEQLGRLQAPGNPVQYGTTALFLRHFGLRSLGDLPPLGQVEGQDAKAALQEAMESVPEDAPENEEQASEATAPGADTSH